MQKSAMTQCTIFFSEIAQVIENHLIWCGYCRGVAGSSSSQYGRAAFIAMCVAESEQVSAVMVSGVVPRLLVADMVEVYLSMGLEQG